MEEHKHFKPKAHILRLLGDELIKSPIMAIYELIKNSYDADSEYVSVRFDSIDNSEIASVYIQDNGTGLTEDVIENVWLEPGTDHRKPIDEDGKRRIIRSPLYDRVPMGEKGVGRFAVHKMGNHISMITRPAIVEKNSEGIKVKKPLDYEITLTIDWQSFSQAKYLKDIPIKWDVETDKTKFYFANDSGTLIKVSSLKDPWTRRMARGLKRNVVSMLSPKNNEVNFRIDLDFGNQWLDDFPDASDILKIAPYKYTAMLDTDYNLSFDYECKFELNESFGSRKISESTNIKGSLIKSYKTELEQEEELTEEELEEHLSIFDNPLPFGNLMFDTYTYDLDSETLRNYTYDSKTLKSILKFHAGVKVFKDDMRVFDYGDPGNDWLGLENRRVNNKSWMSNKLNIGFVYLDSESSSCLIEKTNREGFVENKEYDLFHKCLIGVLNEYRIERWKDREKWLEFIKPAPKPKSYTDQSTSFIELIDSTDFSDDEKKKKLKEEAENLHNDYEKKKDSLLIPAGVGMTASVALHEIEKLVPRMKEVVNSNPFEVIIANDRVDELNDYVQGILSVLRKGGKDPVDVNSSIEKAISNYSFKLKTRKISIEKSFNDWNTMVCDKRYFITMVMNVIDNSIHWLDTIYKEDKGIYFKTYLEDDNKVVLIVDNGPGFKDSIEDIVRPFFSRRDDGIGIGLYLIDTIMMKYGKFEIIEPEELNDIGVPDRYRGAAVKLTFNKSQ